MKKISLSILFFTGFLGGVLWVYADLVDWMAALSLLGLDCLWKIEQMTIDKRALVFLALGKRLRAFFVLWLFSLTPFRKPAAVLFFLLCGLSTGITAQLLAVRYRLWVLLLYPALLLPQILLYVPGFYGMGVYCMKTAAPSGRSRLLAGFYLLLIMGGTFLEAWVNPVLLEWAVSWLNG